MKAALVLLTGIILVFSISYSYSRADIIKSANEKLVLKVEKINEVLNKYPQDSQLHLGAAELYRIVGGIPNNPHAGSLKLYEAALRLDPQDLAARAAWMRSVFGWHVQKLEQYYRDLKEADDIEQGKERVPLSDNSLQRQLNKDMQAPESRRIGAKNVREEAARLKSEMRKTAWFLNETKSAQKMDPDNALYNYLMASIYFKEGQKEKAVKEIEKGVRKGRLSTYTKERVIARARILEEIDFPWPERALFLTTCSPFVGYGGIFRDLLKIGKNYEKGDEFKKAKQIYGMIGDIGEQSEQDSFFIMERIRSLDVKQMGDRALKRLYQTTKLEGDREKISSELKGLDSEKEELFNLLKRYPRYDDISKAKELKALTKQIIEKGDLETLKNWK